MATASDPAGRVPAHRVLVIDDERGPRESLRMLLKKEYEVVCADSVDAGVALLREHRPEAVIMDIRMPDKTGIEGLREIRAIDPLVAVVMFTGYGTLETAQEAIRLGATDYLKKPIDTRELVDVMRRCVQHTVVERRRRQADGELKALTQQLRDELQHKNQLASLGQRSAEIVHDLRNPLTAVLGYVSLLADQLRRSPVTAGEGWAETSEYLEMIEQSVHRCQEMVEMWLGQSRAKPGHRQGARLPDLVDEVLRRVVGTAGSRGVTLRHDREGDADRPIRADAMQLQRAIQNIVVNAVEAAPDRTGRVHVTSRRDAGRFRLTVADNGPGIPAEVRPMLFTPFCTNKQGGTGLGLCVAKQAVEQHNGTIVLDDTVGGGTTVTIEIPAVDA